jgi:hypothetical protein
MALIHSRAPRSVMKHTTPFQGGHTHGHPITRAKSKPPRSQSVRLAHIPTACPSWHAAGTQRTSGRARPVNA